MRAELGPHSVKSIAKCRNDFLIITACIESQYARYFSEDIQTPTPRLRGSHIKCSMGTTDKGIEIELEKYHVIRAHRITKKLGGKSFPTFAIKLVSSYKEIPEFVIFGYSRSHVKPYVATVIQCFRCRRFGHFLPLPPVEVNKDVRDAVRAT